MNFTTFRFCLKTNWISESCSGCWLSVWVDPSTHPRSSSGLIDLYLDFMHAWLRAVIKQCDLNIQMTVLIEENKCSHMAALAVLSSARGRVPERPRPIWSRLSGNYEPTNTTAAKPWLLLMPPGSHCAHITLHAHTHCAGEEAKEKRGGEWSEWQHNVMQQICTHKGFKQREWDV